MPDDKDKPAPEVRQGASVERGFLAANNERKRRAAARLFAVFWPPVATRMERVEEDAAGFVQLLESGQKPSIADIREWAKRQWFVCHRIFFEPAPPSLDRLMDRWFVWWPLGGRPSSRDLVRAEAQRRLAAGAVPATLKEFANELAIWLAENHPDTPKMVGRVVEGHIRDLWHTSGR